MKQPNGWFVNDMIVFNDVSRKNSGFESDSNEIVILDKKGRKIFKGRDTKENLAGVIIDKIERMFSR